MHNPKWTAIISPSDGPNIQRTVYMPEDHVNKWQLIKRNHVGNYYLTSMLRALYELAIQPGGRLIGIQKKVSAPFEMYFKLDTLGNIQMTAFKVNEKLVEKSAQSSGLYKAIFDEEFNRWKTDNIQLKRMNLSHQWKGAHTAAVGGKFKTKEDCCRVLGNHIVNAYKTAFSPAEAQAAGNHYSLFWMNNEFASKEHTNSLVSLIQQAQRQKSPMRWLVQGESVGAFVRAMEYIQKNPVSSDLVTAQRGLEYQAVFFSNPRGKHTSEKELQVLCKKTGLHYAGININKSDFLFNADARQDFSDEVLKSGSAIVLGGLAGYAGFSTLSSAFNAGMSAGTVTGTVVVGTAAYIFAKDKVTKFGGYFRNVPAAVNSTLGKGNQRWAG